MTNETIKIYYYPVDSIAGLTVYHETAVYTNAEGQYFYSEATDTVPNQSLNLSYVGTAHNMVAAALEVSSDDPSVWGTLEANTNIQFNPGESNSIGVTQDANGN